jgi:hypothetical protein
MAPIDTATSLENLKLERDAIVLYESLAKIEKDPVRAAAFERIAGNERRHADIWAGKLTELGATVPPPSTSPRAQVHSHLAARLLGTVFDGQALEGDEERYDAQASRVAAIAADEREHARIWDELGAAGRAAATGPAPWRGGGGRRYRATASQWRGGHRLQPRCGASGAPSGARGRFAR